MKRTSVRTKLHSNIRIDAETGCWLWTAFIEANGYARVRNESGAREGAHRASYREFVGPIPDGLVIDHLCRVRHCVNPDHLEPVTQEVNVRRGDLANKTECAQGHPFTAESTGVRGPTPTQPYSQRYCRICRKAASDAANATSNARLLAVRAAARAAATCMVCGAPQNGRRLGKYCSDACGQRARRSRPRT